MENVNHCENGIRDFQIGKNADQSSLTANKTNENIIRILLELN